MKRIELSNEALKNYFGFLDKYGSETKKNLIDILTKSIDSEKNDDLNSKNFFGAWEDDRNSDEINAEIRSARVEKNTTTF